MESAKNGLVEFLSELLEIAGRYSKLLVRIPPEGRVVNRANLGVAKRTVVRHGLVLTGIVVLQLLGERVIGPDFLNSYLVDASLMAIAWRLLPIVVHVGLLSPTGPVAVGLE